MKVSLKGYIMMKILFACIFIYIHVYGCMVLLLVFINSQKLSSSKAEREGKQCDINRPARQRDVTVAAQVKSQAFPVLSFPSSVLFSHGSQTQRGG